MVCEMFVIIGMQLQLYRLTIVLRYLRPGLPHLLLAYVGCCLALKQLLLVIAWYIYKFFSPPSHKHVIYRLTHCCL